MCGFGEQVLGPPALAAWSAWSVARSVVSTRNGIIAIIKILYESWFCWRHVRAFRPHWRSCLCLRMGDSFRVLYVARCKTLCFMKPCLALWPSLGLWPCSFHGSFSSISGHCRMWRTVPYLCLRKAYSGLQPSHGSLFSNLVHCRLSGSDQDECMLWHFDVSAPQALALPGTSFLFLISAG